MNLKAVPKMLAMIPSLGRGIDLADLERIKAIARKAYPAVPQLSTQVLAEWMQTGGVARLLLVDVRRSEEFAVSHLRGAVNLHTTEQIARAVTERSPDKTILYCSVGFRSSRLANLLAQRGGRKLFNLEGSIFQWANEGRPVYQGEKVVHQIHPYGGRWAGMLKKGLASDC
jgi:rhodanese-related sulfurtransferase